MRSVTYKSCEFARAAAACLLLFCTVMIGVPLETTGQMSDEKDELQRSGTGVAVVKGTSNLLNKMSVGSFAELRAASTENDHAIAAAAATTGGRIPRRFRSRSTVFQLSALSR